MWIYILVFFIVFLIAWLGIIFYQKKFNAKINKLEDKRKHLFDLAVDNDFHKLAKENLTGESLTFFNYWQQKYSKFIDDTLADLETYFFEAEDSVNKFQFIECGNKIRELEKQISLANDEISQIRDSLKDMQLLQDNDEKLVNEINDKLDEVKRDLLKDANSFGPAQDVLGDQLSNIEERFDNAQQLYLGGDFRKSNPLLKSISNDLTELKLNISLVKQEYSKLDQVLPEQIEDIKLSYDQMIKEGFRFLDDDFDDQILFLQNSIDENKELLVQADIKGVQKNIEQMVKDIDRLFIILDREYNSRRNVLRQRSEIRQFIKHAENQNYSLHQVIYDISNTFILDNNEKNKMQDFSKKIALCKEEYDKDFKKVSNKEAVYSVISRDIELWNRQLTNIEEEQILIIKKLNLKYEEFDTLKSDLLDYDSALRVIARTVEKENLPGVMHDYQEFYIVVNNEIKKLKTILNSDPVDINNGMHLTNLLREDIQTLSNKTNSLIKNARLTEILIQNALQIQDTNQEIADVIKKAKDIYNNEFNYEKSVNILAKKLELIKPKTFQNIINNYQESDALNFDFNNHVKNKLEDE